MCRNTCLTELQKEAVWQAFPDGFEPFRLEIAWDAVGSISLASGKAAQVHLLLEYDLGSGWQTAQEEIWDSDIPDCSEAHPSVCPNNVFVKTLAPEQSTGAIKVRATVKAKMTACGNCGLFDTSQMQVIMAVRNIQIVALGPRLIAEPGYNVTRGDIVTFRVVDAPITSYSNWRYKFSPAVHPDIVRSENINTGSWSGPILLGGTANVVVIVPGRSVSIPLQSESVLSVNPRSWNSVPLPPQKVTGIAPPPGLPDPPVDNGLMGYSAWELDGKFDAVKLDTDGPNRGLSYVTAVYHHNWSGNYYKYEITPHLEQSTTFYSAQCGFGGWISGAVLRANGYEHESGTLRGHYQQYVDKLADPSVNYGKYAEPLVGPASQSFTDFSIAVGNAFGSRRDQLHAAADIEACNSNFRYDAACVSRGNINFAPYQPCQ